MARQTSIIGFPRIGKNRELKFSTEKFFRNEISEEELKNTATIIKKYGWEKQKEAGINFIPSNDFSFYDNMLDTAFLLGAVPKRYTELDLSFIETYFAAAHGYQGENGDVKALPMKKWFNTNYHYLVPELSDDTKISLTDNPKPLEEFTEAKSLGITTVPALQGLYTFLHLSSYSGKKSPSDFVEKSSEVYSELAVKLEKLGAEWISFSEPALVLDITEEEKTLFCSIYKNLLDKIKSKSNLKIILQTFFGDIRDVYDEAITLDFDGIGLDFIEGKKNLDLIQKGFPKNKFLFAGIINGKNIWRTNYSEKNKLLSEIEKSVSKDKIIISPSCSLLHVPYTTLEENKLSEDIKKHFAFAQEKLTELSELSSLEENAYEKNKKLFENERVYKTPSVQNALNSLKEEDFVRSPCFEEREKIQKKVFNLPEFPTTTIGSFPQTKEVRQKRAGYRKGEISKEDYIEFNKKKIAECIAQQENIGLDVLVHGEFERNDMVEYFGTQMYGYIFTENAWVQSYGTRCVKPPVIWNDVARKNPITVNWSVYAQSKTKKTVKGMLTGPVTILNWSFPREDISLKEQAFQIALAIREEVLDLEKNGIKIIQIDEAALREKLPLRKIDWHKEYLDWAIPAFRLVHAKTKAETQIHTHMCYSEFNDIIHEIDEMDADVITFEASRSDLKILSALKESNFKTEVGPGVYDIHSPRIPAVDEIINNVQKILEKVPREKLWINPDCGLKTRGEKETWASLKNLVEAAHKLRA